MNKRPVVVCADPGIDDFIALNLLLDRPELDILGIVALSGNVGLGVTVNNALVVTELCHRQDVPVLVGSAKPLCRPARSAASIHGASGLGKSVFLTAHHAPSDESGTDFIVRMAKAHPGQLQLISLGPLTDVALAFQAQPEIVSLVKDVLVMGGGIHRGNATAYAEFNIAADPEAAALVFASDVHVTMVGLDATHQCLIPRSRIDDLAADSALGQVVPAMLHDYADVYKELQQIEGIIIHDAISVLPLWQPDWFDRHQWHVYVCLEEGEHLGQTVADETGASGKAPNCTVVMNCDAQKVNAAILEGMAAVIRKHF